MPGDLTNPPPVRLAGLTVAVNLPGGARLPPPWPAFEMPFSSCDQPALRLTIESIPCPWEPQAPPLNDSPYFHLHSVPGGALLGIPVNARWRAVYEGRAGTLRVFAPPGSGVAAPSELADQVLWRFRPFFLAVHDRMVFHALGAMKDGRALLFAGDSGSGKSTLGGLLRESGWTVLSDESPIVEALPDGGFRVWGSPWPSSGGFADSGSAPLGGLFLLVHGQEDRKIVLRPGDMVRRLVGERLFLCPWFEEGARDRLLGLLDRLVQAVSCARLEFRPGRDVVTLLEKD